MICKNCDMDMGFTLVLAVLGGSDKKICQGHEFVEEKEWFKLKEQG